MSDDIKYSYFKSSLQEKNTRKNYPENILFFLCFFLAINFAFNWPIHSLGSVPLRIVHHFIDYPTKQQIDRDTELSNLTSRTPQQEEELKDLTFTPFVINLFLSVIMISFIGFLIDKFFIVRKYPLLYLRCPYDDCKMSIKIHYKWVCDKCKNTQNKEHFITEDCDVCEQKLETFFCEHCGREFYL